MTWPIKGLHNDTAIKIFYGNFFNTYDRWTGVDITTDKRANIFSRLIYVDNYFAFIAGMRLLNGHVHKLTRAPRTQITSSSK